MLGRKKRRERRVGGRRREARDGRECVVGVGRGGGKKRKMEREKKERGLGRERDA